MFEELKKNLWTTKIFFLVRFVAACGVGLVYIIIATAIQYMFVSWFGESTFNYIVGGSLSLYLGAIACTYLGRLLYMFIRGWHMGALAFVKQIRNKNLPPLEAGMTVFKKHFTSFAVVYGSSILIKRFAKKGSSELWKLLEDVPYLGSLEKFAKSPIVTKIGEDLLDTAFDGVMFYLLKYTKPGLGDDASALPDALRRYIYALPQIVLSSLALYFLLYVVPKAIRILIMIALILSNGLVAGILMNVLAYPVFYILQHSIFEPLEIMVFISCYSKHCRDDIVDEGIFKTFVDKILDSIGIDLGGDSTGERDIAEGGEAESEPEAEVEATDASSSDDGQPLADDEIINVEPEFDEPVVPASRATSVRGTSGSSSVASLNSLLDRAMSADVSSLPLTDDEKPVGKVNAPVSFSEMMRGIGDDIDDDTVDISDIEDDDDEEDAAPPVTKLTSLLGSLSESSMQEAFSITPEAQDDDDNSNSSSLWGGDIDYD